MKKISFIFWFIWGLPQNLIGLFMYFMQGSWVLKRKYKDSIVSVRGDSRKGAVSLGQFIFLFSNYGERTDTIIKHEYGHTIQSKILGPLYLIVIGLPSLIWNIGFEKYRRKHNISYYSFWTERWANKLGGLN